MICLFGLFISYLICSTYGQSYIVIKNADSTQAYYFSVFVQNYDASSCGDSVASVSLYEAGNWRVRDQTYYETDGLRVAWNYVGTAFNTLLPASLRITMSSGRTIDLSGIVANLNVGASFTSSSTICGGTAKPTAPTAKPTGKPTEKPTTGPPTTAQKCWTAPIEWKSYNNQIYLNGYRFNMKGLSWFGYETGNYNLYGLDQHSQDWYFSWMRSNGFNAMRLPFSQDFVNSGSTNLNKYKATVNLAGQYGIYVMIDFHSKTAGSWQDGLYTLDQTSAIATWQTMADLLKCEYNVFVADCFNEPHDVTNSQWSDWINFCENVAKAIWAKGVNWLIAVEGTNYDCTVISCAWGENLEGLKTGVIFDEASYGANRVIYSPHVYGYDVTGNSAYSTAGWYAHWGFINDQLETAVVIGEFGTKYDTTTMQGWLDSLVSYLISLDQRNTFFWCLNPNSGDTGGLLQDDWTTPQTAKLAALQKLQPSPSVTTYSNGQICVSNLGAAGTPSSPVSSPTTKSPTVQAPVSSPTTSPPTTTTASSSGGKIRLTVKDGANVWWFAVVPSEIPSGVTIKSLEMKDSQMSTYELGTFEWDYCKFTKYVPYKGPFTFRITTTGGSVTTTSNVLSSTGVNVGDYGYANVGSAYGASSDTTNNTLDWTAWFAIIICSLLFIACIVGIVIYMKRKNKGDVTFDHGNKNKTTNTPNNNATNDTPNDIPNVTQTQNEDEAEIEVEMNVTED